MVDGRIPAHGDVVGSAQHVTCGGRAVKPTGDETQRWPGDVCRVGPSQFTGLHECSVGLSEQPSLGDSDGALSASEPASGKGEVGTSMGFAGMVEDLGWDRSLGPEGDFTEDHLLDVDWLDESDPLLELVDEGGEPVK